ncbi:MAG TPA: hypothetical protein VGR49_03095 [Actinomycetota bacterium]|nr:hypothetical protein [Actinomycetota bacterium]
MRTAHLAMGLFIVGGFGVLWLWGLTTWILRRGPGRAFWWLVAAVQVALIAQLVAGVILLLLGGRRPILHYAYGVVFPVFVLMGAHWVAREVMPERPWAPFAVASFIASGLTLRALTTGLGIG